MAFNGVSGSWDALENVLGKCPLDLTLQASGDPKKCDTTGIISMQDAGAWLRTKCKVQGQPAPSRCDMGRLSQRPPEPVSSAGRTAQTPQGPLRN